MVTGRAGLYAIVVSYSLDQDSYR